MRANHAISWRRILPALFLLTILPCAAGAERTVRKTENVLIVTLDGLRWQEIFGGADETLLDGKNGGVRDLPDLKRRFWRETPEARRTALMPFLWETIGKQGQIFGNPARKANARSTNGLKFSYPGYSEMFCGVADPRVDSNSKKDNPNLSVLEFLNGRPAFRDHVEAVCTWDVFPSIFRVKQSRLPVHSGWDPFKGDNLTDRERQANEFLERLPRYWTDNVFDVFTMEVARSALERRHPRVLFIGLGETDEWGHGRRYDLYLDSAHKSDRFLAETWQALQKVPQYKDKTALVLTTDHGRGSTRGDWTDHGKKVPGAEFVWIAAIGPDTPGMGERENVEVTQSQIAATVAALLGEDFSTACKEAAKPLPIFADK
jgi:hypothetical protein